MTDPCVCVGGVSSEQLKPRPVARERHRTGLVAVPAAGLPARRGTRPTRSPAALLPRVQAGGALAGREAAAVVAGVAALVGALIARAGGKLAVAAAARGVAVAAV